MPNAVSLYAKNFPVDPTEHNVNTDAQPLVSIYEPADSTRPRKSWEKPTNSLMTDQSYSSIKIVLASHLYSAGFNVAAAV